MNRRLEKVNSLLREEINNIITKDIDFAPGVFVGVIKVETSPDLAVAKVWISVIPSPQRSFALSILGKRIPFILSLLKNRLTLKYIPTPRFIADESQDKTDRINSLLKNLQVDDNPRK